MICFCFKTEFGNAFLFSNIRRSLSCPEGLGFFLRHIIYHFSSAYLKLSFPDCTFRDHFYSCWKPRKLLLPYRVPEPRGIHLSGNWALGALWQLLFATDDCAILMGELEGKNVVWMTFHVVKFKKTKKKSLIFILCHNSPSEYQHELVNEFIRPCYLLITWNKHFTLGLKGRGTCNGITSPVSIDGHSFKFYMGRW